ncbi:hypothetical protein PAPPERLAPAPP_00710 [Brevundimonas phage vB_BpoS-Papperlapapp]|uniref:Lipoprotein n=1 Tax=Brevundimonas phage vB_BpoS-Domovoi TaxID=2948598 RepID=A0A9E7MRF1_9CAUD|nr:hypothetical protein DOMOVOI_05480 [Brevundimonas phage vB_BpoS-Domovoi]USN15813.1 hypothetical protein PAPPERLAPAPP_00710 [Brevundimonas phage vB_BpoS-Papperlapapp]
MWLLTFILALLILSVALGCGRGRGHQPRAGADKTAPSGGTAVRRRRPF